MKKLSEMVDVIENNEKYAVLKVKDNQRMDLIFIGFSGDEDIIRLQKKRPFEIRLWHNNGEHFSWDWRTVVTDSLKDYRDIITDCIVNDFGIKLQ